jgi:hypothetical protein
MKAIVLELSHQLLGKLHCVNLQLQWATQQGQVHGLEQVTCKMKVFALKVIAGRKCPGSQYRYPSYLGK